MLNKKTGGTLYNYFRDYEPGTGRYVQSDPIGIQGGVNTYMYANQSPLLFIDPNGLRSCQQLQEQYRRCLAACDRLLSNCLDTYDWVSDRCISRGMSACMRLRTPEARVRCRNAARLSCSLPRLGAASCAAAYLACMAGCHLPTGSTPCCDSV